MSEPKKNPQAAQDGVEGSARGSVEIQDTSENGCKQALAELFPRPNWVPWQLKWNEQRGKFDKIPSDGKHGLSTVNPSHWLPYAAAAAIAERPEIDGVGLVMTGSIDEGDWRLVGLDFDDVDFDNFKIPFQTYAERSPSGTGVRMFAWAPLTWAAQYRDTMDCKPANCAHCEVYLGTSGRFLTVTFDRINEEGIAQLDAADLKRLESWGLNKFEVAKPLQLPEGMGEPLNLADFELTTEQLEVATGTLEGDRSPVVHGLLIKLFNKGASMDDALATVIAVPALQKYVLDHRSGDGSKALQFAMEEVARAFERSIPGMLENLARYAKPMADPASPAGQQDDPYRLPRIDERVKRPRKARFAIGQQFLKESTTMIVGDTGAGKTTLSVYTAVCKAHAVRDPTFLWNGMPIHDPRPQQYIAGEDDIGVEDMVIGLCMELGIPLEGLPLCVSTQAYDFSLPGEVARLKAACAADLAQYGKLPDWTVDTLSRNAGTLEENSATDMRVLLAHLDELRGDASMNVLHHNGVDPKAQNRERGSSVLRKDPTANYTCRKDGDLFFLECQTQRGAKKPELLVMQFKEVVIGKDYDDHGNEIGDRTTYILLPTGKAHRDMRANAFYDANPELAERGRRKYLRVLLAKILNKPGADQRALAELCEVSQARLRRTLEVLRSKELATGGTEADPRPLQLTQGGMEALRELEIDVAVEFKAAGADVQALAREKPLKPALVAASVAKKGLL